jgi:hypothetical protein
VTNGTIYDTSSGEIILYHVDFTNTEIANQYGLIYIAGTGAILTFEYVNFDFIRYAINEQYDDSRLGIIRIDVGS